MPSPRPRRRARSLLAAAIALAVPSLAPAQLVGPTPYLGFVDSPFIGLVFDYFHLETFEDGALNEPGVSLLGPGAVVPPGGPLSDSVDDDDGAIDGTGANRRALFTNFARSELTFDFDAAPLGGLPTHAGIVWTDVGNVLPGSTFPFAVGPVLFEAFGPGLVPLGSTGPVVLGDGVLNGTTAEDRFFGIVAAGGIQRIRISMSNSVDWEVDHLQYGRMSAVPEPATLALLVPGVLLAAAVRHRRR